MQLANHTHGVELGAAGRRGRSDQGRRMRGREQGEGGGGREERGWSEEAMMRGRMGAGV